MQRTGSKVTTEEAGVQSSAPGDTDLLAAYSKGSAASYKKLSHFFGEAPPRVEDLESLLEELGYMHLLPVCESVLLQHCNYYRLGVTRQLNCIKLLCCFLLKFCGHVFYGHKWVTSGCRKFLSSECFDLSETVFNVTLFVDSFLIIIPSISRQCNH